MAVHTNVLTPDDQRILEITKSLCVKLNISGIKPDWVSWQDYSPRGGFGNRLSTVPYDGCVFDDNTIVLQKAMRSKLEPDDWASLIASELIYRFKVRERLSRGLLVRLGLPTILYILIPVLLWQYGIFSLQGTATIRGQPVPAVVAFFYIYPGTVLVFVVFLYVVLGLPYARRLRLSVDQETVSILGRQEFAATLEKLGRSYPELMKKSRPFQYYPLGRPSVKKRMDKVQATAPS